MLGYCKQCRLYKLLSGNKKCDSCNGSYAQFNRDYEVINSVTDRSINTTINDLTNTSDIRE